MDPIHPAHAFSDPLFYDRSRPASAAHRYRVPANAGYQNWRSAEDERWTHWAPPSGNLLEQGWKVHVSATPETAETVLRFTAEYCLDVGLHFKHLRDASVLGAALAKDAERSSAGKFVTIYPDSISGLRECLTTLDAQLGGLPGPYILSDLRWNSGPLYVRYGAFTLSWVQHDGHQVPAIRDLDRHVLVPDVRSAAFIVPPWVQIPEFLDEQIGRLQAAPPRWFPRITQLVQHSNAGGVYEAVIGDRPAILKEARPHSGYTPDGRDAVARLHAEERVLRGLPDSARAPRVVESFELHGHRFLAMERAQGRSLAHVVASTNPLGSSRSDTGELRNYRDWALSVGRQLRDAIDALHAEGRSHGDLHPGNVLVDDSGSITVVDFEMSQSTKATSAAQFGVPGFVAQGTSDPMTRDRFAVACIELHMFIPLTPLLHLDANKLDELSSLATITFNLPEDWGLELTARTRPGLARTERLVRKRGSGTTASIVEGLLKDATPSRLDRLWPGDPRQFREEPFSIAHGALGIAVTLHAAGVPVDERTHAWIRGAINERRRDGSVGLMDGIAGAISGCRQIGWTELADDLLSDLTERNLDSLGFDLYSGAPGVALVLLDQSRQYAGLQERALQLLERTANYWHSRECQPQVSTGRGGLMRGASGLALAALRAHSVTQDSTFTDIARASLDHDIATLVQTSDAALHVNEGWRTLPYLGSGSAGIGLVLAQYMRVTGHMSEFADILTKITAAACTPFTAQVGLLNGRAGLIRYLLELEQLGCGTPETASFIASHRERVWLHALRRDGVTRFAGDGLLRASCDLATGSAGVLSVLIDAPTLSFLSAPVGESVTESREGGEIHGVSAFASIARAQ